jgi:putative spermidine/putrescine transport system substrate-binding protein
MKGKALLICLISFLFVFMSCIVPNLYAEEELVVMSWGGRWGDSLQKNIIDPFQKETGVKVTLVHQLNGRDGLNKLRAQKANPQVDIWTADNSTQGLAAKHGLLLEVTEDMVPNLKYSRDKGTEYSLNWYYHCPGLFYRIDKTPFELKGWEDCWDPRLKGKIAVPEATFTAGRFLVIAALLAGGSEQNMEPGFKKLEELKPNIAMFYKTDAQSIKFLESGEASVSFMGLLPNVYKLLGEGSNYRFVIPKYPQLLIFNNIAIVKGRANTELAAKFTNYMLSPEAQEAHCSTLGLVPINTQAKFPVKLEKIIPKESGGWYQVDLDMINKNLREWTETYNKRVKAR